MSDDAQRLRIRADDDEATLGQDQPDLADGALTVVASTTVVSSYPTTASCYYAVQAMTVLGTEAEGAAGSVSSDGSAVFFALNLGSAIPPQNTQVLVTRMGNRWVFRYDG